jgi:hypothetical protein
MDSTPIMPQPKAFVRFARAYMTDHGLDVLTKLLPEPVHTWFYTSRWGVGGAYVRLKHKVSPLARLSPPPPSAAPRAQGICPGLRAPPASVGSCRPSVPLLVLPDLAWPATTRARPAYHASCLLVASQGRRGGRGWRERGRRARARVAGGVSVCRRVGA